MAHHNDETLAECSFDAERRDLLDGRLPEERIDAFEAHLDTCPRCATEIEKNLNDDSLSDLLRNLSSDALTDEECQSSIRLVRGLSRSDSKTDEIPVRTLGQYELLDKIGAGGMGEVYRARHRLMHRQVAVKIIHAHSETNSVLLERFQREILASAQLDHPNIVRAEYADEADGTLFLVMEYVRGRNLSDHVKSHGPLSPGEAVRVALAVGSALSHLHTAGFVHRDLKPSNLLWTEDSHVKLADLGLASHRAEFSDSDLTGSGTILGTCHYMAPEQWDDTSGVDIRADMYSLGCSLYFLLAGQPPFASLAGNAPTKLMRAHATATPRALREIRPDIPPALADIIARLMQKEADERFQTPDELLAALEPLSDYSPKSKTTKFDSPQRERSRWRNLVLGTCATACLVAVGFFAWKFARNDPAPPPQQPRTVGKPSPPIPEPPRLATTEFRVRHFRGDPPIELGLLGEHSSAMLVDDDLKVELAFSEEVYCYLIAFAADGSSELCWPRSQDVFPEPVSKLRYPSASREFFFLGEGPGLQVFAVVASREPLPTYKLWAKTGIPRWRPLTHELAWGVWRTDGGRARLIDEPKVRGVRLLGLLPSVVRCSMISPTLGLAGLPWEAYASVARDGPADRIEELARSLRSRPKIDSVHLLGFAVRPK